MRRVYSLLLWSLMLFSIACKKEDEPALVGTWVKQRGTTTSYDERNQLISTIEVPGTFSLVLTGQTMKYFRSDGVGDGGPYPYTRRGNKVTLDNKLYLTITTLTEHTLTLHYEGEVRRSTPGTNDGGRTDTDVYYTR